MSYARYVKDHFCWVCICFFLVVTIDIFLLIIQGAFLLRLYVAVSLAAAFFVGTYWDYRKAKKFFSEMEAVLDSLDQKYLLPELLGAGETREQELYVYVLKQAELSMGDRIAEYRRRNAEYKDYIETWVHEVKIPIAAAEMILENHKNDAVKDTGIESELKRIQNYVEQALFFARSEAVEQDYMVKEIDLREIAETVIADKKRLLREKRARVNLHDMEASRKILSDGKWIAFILSQIVDNSVKYAKEGEALVLEFFLSEEAEGTFFHIKDNGIGMKSSEVGRVFEKGFTGTNGRSVRASTGMGLYLCKKLCLRLEHDLRMESKEGEGTELMILFRH